MLAEAEDILIRDCAVRLRDRKLPKCIDIRNRLIAKAAPEGTLTGKCGVDGKKRVDRLTELIKDRLLAWSDANSTTTPRILVDSSRTPYKPFHQTTGPLNQILIRSTDDKILDMTQCSSVISGLETLSCSARMSKRRITAREPRLKRPSWTNSGGKKMSDKPDRQKAAEIVRDAGGEIVGRTRLQKVGYLLDLAGLGDGFRFEYHHYGPYSEELANAVRMAEAFNLVSEEEHSASWGGTYSIFKATDRAGQAIEGERACFAQAAAKINSIELELAATAAYLAAAEKCPDPWEETARRKPEKATGGRIDRAKDAYRQLLTLKGAKRLPRIV